MNAFFQRLKANRIQLIAGSLIVFASGLPWWLIDYSTYSLSNSYTYISIASCFIGAFLLALLTRFRFKEILGIVLLSHMIAFSIKVMLDLLEDSTNHNLIPFEIGFYFIIDLAGCAAMIGVGLLLRNIIPGKKG